MDIFSKRKRAIFLLGSILPSLIWGNPSGGKVSHGKAKFDHPSPETLRITAEDNAVINWDQFSIQRGECTQFIQAGKHSAVLNRVTGKDPSAIFGKLLANGKVYLVNPHGVLIGKEGLIRTGGFLASTLDLSDADFLGQDHLHFKGESKKGITNQGTIEAETGDIILIGYSVSNEGSLVAPEGTAALGAGLDVLVKPKEAQKLYIKPEFSAEKAALGVDNQGTITSLEAELRADGSIYSKAVRHSGSIDATKTEVRGGRVLLVSEYGQTEVSGKIRADQGEVQVLGAKAAVIGEATIDVSSEKGGGQIFVGGGFQGKDPDLIRSLETVLSEKAQLLSDAKINGDGGKVIVWSDGETHVTGSISAQGGPEGGNGGFVEVSGVGFLDFRGHVNTLAPKGNAGTLFLDPTDLSFPTVANMNVPLTSPIEPVVCGLTTQLSGATLQSALIFSNVIIQTTNCANDGNPQAGDINVIGPFTFPLTSHSLTLNAQGSINFTNSTAAINNTGTGGISLNTVTGNINILGDGSTSTLSTLGAIALTGGNGANGFDAPAGGNGGNGGSGGSISITSANITFGTGGLTLNAGSGGIGGQGGNETIITPAGSGGTGGNAGNIHIVNSSLGNSTTTSQISLSTQSGGAGGTGGSGGTPGAGGPGGLGGSVNIASSLITTTGDIGINTPAGSIDTTNTGSGNTLLTGNNISLIAGVSAGGTRSIFKASKQLLIVTDNAAGCNTGPGLLSFQNSALVSPSILLFAAFSSSVNLSGTTLNGQAFNLVSKNPLTCYNSVASNLPTSPPSPIFYKGTTTSSAIASAISQTNQALANASGAQGTQNNFTSASPRTIWILLLFVFRKIRGLLSNLIRRTRIKLLSFLSSLFLLAFCFHPLHADEEQVAAQEEVHPNPTIKGIMLISSADKLLPPEDVKDIEGVHCVDVCLPETTYCLNDRLYKRVNAPFCPEWLCEVKREIMAYYQECNRPFMIVEIPEQDITDGVVQLVVKEGKIGKITCTGNEYYPKEYFADILGLREGQQILYDVLSESVAWLGMRPFSDAELIFKPGENEGEVDVEIIASDRKPWRVFGGADNSGTRATSFGRLFAGAIIDDVFKSGGVLTAQYKGSWDFEKLRSYLLGYTVPLRCGHILTTYGGYATVRPKIHSFKSTGFFGQASAFYSIPMDWRMCRWANNIGFGVNWKRLNNNLLFVDNPEPPIIDGTVNLTQLVGSYHLGKHYEKHSITFTSTLIVSPGDVIAQESNHDYEELQHGAHSLYTYLLAYGQFISYLPREFTLTVRAAGQASTGTLLPSEQLSLGGPESIRAYDPGEYLADNGLSATLEVVAPPIDFCFGKTKSYLLFLGFLEGAVGNQYHPLAGTRKTDYLAGIGPGARFKIDPYLEVDLDWGIKFHKVKGGSDAWQKFYFSLTACY